MDAKKVLAVLREIETYSTFAGTVAKDETKVCTYCSGFNKHYDDCKLAALIAALEHEAQAEPGGWRPGTEVPSDTQMLDWLQAKREEDGKYSQWCIDLDPEEPLLSFAMSTYIARHSEILSLDIREAIRAAMIAEQAAAGKGEAS